MEQAQQVAEFKKFDNNLILDWLTKRDNKFSTYLDGNWAYVGSQHETFQSSLVLPGSDIRHVQVMSMYVMESAAIHELLSALQNKPLDRLWRVPSYRTEFFSRLRECYMANKRANLSISAGLATYATGVPIRITELKTEARLIQALRHHERFTVNLHNYDHRRQMALVLFDEHDSLIDFIVNQVVYHLACGLGVSILVPVGKNYVHPIFYLSHFVELATLAGIPHSALNLLLLPTDRPPQYLMMRKPSDYLVPLVPETQLIKTTPAAVVFADADLDSALDKIMELIIQSDFGLSGLALWVHEQIFTMFCAKFNSYSQMQIGIGTNAYSYQTILQKGLGVNFDVVDLDTVLDDDLAREINIFKFRNAQDIEKSLGHVRHLHYVSIWTKNVSLALEFTTRVKNCGLFWINGSGIYDFDVPFDDGYHGTVMCPSNLYFTIDLRPQLNLRAIPGSATREAETAMKYFSYWSARPLEFRYQTLVNTLSYAKSLNDIPNGHHQLLEKLKVMKDLLYTIKESGNYNVITRHAPRGVIMLNANERQILPVLEYAMLSLLAGNTVFIFIDDSVMYSEYSKLMTSMLQHGLDQGLIYLKAARLPIDTLDEFDLVNIVLNNKLVGLYMHCLREHYNIRDLLGIISKYNTIWIPSAGLIEIHK